MENTEDKNRSIRQNYYNSEAYRQFRSLPPESLIQRILSYLKEKYTGTLDLAVDLGCGTGQCTFLIAEHFANVIGSDVSETQLEEAKDTAKTLAYKNIQFTLSSSPSISCSDESVQLITAATSAHWMDLPQIFEEAKRVLSPGGVMALLCSKGVLWCGSPQIIYRGNETKSAKLTEVLKTVHDDFATYVPPSRRAQIELVLNEYKDITIPMNDFVRESGFYTERPVSINFVAGLIKSLSGFKKFVMENGESKGKEYLEKVIIRLKEATELDDIESELLIHKPEYFVLMARK